MWESVFLALGIISIIRWRVQWSGFSNRPRPRQHKHNLAVSSYTCSFQIITRIVCIRPKGCAQCIFPRSQHSCLYVYIYWPKVNLYQVVVGQQSVRTLLKSLAQLFSSAVPSGSGAFQMPTCPSASSASSAAASTLRGGRANLRNASVTFSLFLHEASLGWH